MKQPYFTMRLNGVLVPLLFTLLVLAACSGKKIPGEAKKVQNEPAAGSTAPAWSLLALLQTGGNPLWFEFGSEGPVLIESPAAASLTSFVPWPLARYAAGTEAWGNSFVMAVNRDGFVVIAPAEGQDGALLYRAADPGRWEPYTIASLFFYEGCPSVLLYRDDFFASTLAPMPSRQVFALREDIPMPLDVSVPALEVLPKEEGWEVNSLRRGPDGDWYYRFSQTGLTRGGTAFYRAKDLSLSGEKTGLAEYRNSSRPENAAAAPSFVSPMLAALPAHIPGLEGTPVLRLLSPRFSGSRLFSDNPAAEEDFIPLFGYFRDEDAALPSPLFALTPDGRGIASAGGSFFGFSLPPLPEGFVYTAAGLAGTVLVAVWEEQEDSLVGAAGFMALDAKTLGLFGNGAASVSP